ncbi:MAG: 3-keto-disaccharide hydrolase, partial [Akkermansiaceae bacterium]
MIHFLLFAFSTSLLSAEEASLFPSGTLDDWTAKGRARWSYQGGVLSGGQDGDPKRSGLLISKASFQDFDLSFEFKIDEHGKYNSGIYLRYQAGQKGNHLQVNIGRGAAGEPVGL